MLDILNPIELVQLQGVDALVNTDGRGCATTCGDMVTGGVKLNVLGVLNDVLLDIVILATRALLS